jgi:hypothetical protein
MQNSVLSGIVVAAVAWLAAWPEARAATLQQCAQNHYACNGQCSAMSNPMTPDRYQHCLANCGIARGQCDASASDRNAAPPPASQTKRTRDSAAPGIKPSLLERDTAPAGTSPAPTGRPAGTQGGGGVQLR